ncbi:MAG: hypothetical protein AAGU11_23400, partial [Syntrophobacteraceae bacterium]
QLLIKLFRSKNSNHGEPWLLTRGLPPEAAVPNPAVGQSGTRNDSAVMGIFRGLQSTYFATLHDAGEQDPPSAEEGAAE